MYRQIPWFMKGAENANCMSLHGWKMQAFICKYFYGNYNETFTDCRVTLNLLCLVVKPDCRRYCTVTHRAARIGCRFVHTFSVLAFFIFVNLYLHFCTCIFHSSVFKFCVHAFSSRSSLQLVLVWDVKLFVFALAILILFFNYVTLQGPRKRGYLCRTNSESFAKYLVS